MSNTTKPEGTLITMIEPGDVFLDDNGNENTLLRHHDGAKKGKRCIEVRMPSGVGMGVVDDTDRFVVVRRGS